MVMAEITSGVWNSDKQVNELDCRLFSSVIEAMIKHPPQQSSTALGKATALRTEQLLMDSQAYLGNLHFEASRPPSSIVGHLTYTESCGIYQIPGSNVPLNMEWVEDQSECYHWSLFWPRITQSPGFYFQSSSKTPLVVLYYSMLTYRL
ncbi:uncharacterized protein EAF01_002228 [Botrytis porri]|uniref:uncharacterized protein n=1 Tax=Botrytis porri TaxID=87229 RepID=UPI001900BD20|nr:uncharacterized protein EAF01_002228 [Botrytis porri]KAF7910719.1 hypothetical protein EAF01_002228 [Botrytis porri]